MILLIVPSRNRPESVQRCYKYWSRTQAGQSRVVLMVDDDDPADYNMPPWIVDRRPRLNLVQKLNAAAQDHAEGCNIIGFIGDDVTIETPKWDRWIVQKMATMHKCSILFPNDGFQGGRPLPNHIFMSLEAYKRLGWFVYPKMHHCWIDHVWREIGKRLQAAGGYYHAKEIMMRHRHPSLDPNVKPDQTHREIYQHSITTPDKVAFRAYCASDIDSDVRRLLA